MTTEPVSATAEGFPTDTAEILLAIDTMRDARNLIECVLMAASSLMAEEREAIGTATTIAIGKLKEARDILHECLAPQEGGAS